MPKLYKGTKEILSLAGGVQNVKALYKGNDLIWGAEEYDKDLIFLFQGLKNGSNDCDYIKNGYEKIVSTYDNKLFNESLDESKPISSLPVMKARDVSTYIGFKFYDQDIWSSDWSFEVWMKNTISKESSFASMFYDSNKAFTLNICGYNLYNFIDNYNYTKYYSNYLNWNHFYKEFIKSENKIRVFVNGVLFDEKIISERTSTNKSKFYINSGNSSWQSQEAKFQQCAFWKKLLSGGNNSFTPRNTAY